ncbi:ATP-binding cassette domain-containing protein [Amycolatopsis sp. cmx-4-68]|uniref:ABC transporter ATP-binding protein n=1 Tax=Amycolatopsis sp. cmx-4-68 TaxID=2790938 RepID=UPI00397ADD27
MLTVEHLTKVYRVPAEGGRSPLRRRTYRDLTAVDDMSFTIGDGEAVGYVGANGAGKSTTIKMMTGLLAPTSGTVRLNGLDPRRRRMAVTRQIGVVFGQRSQLWPDLTVRESFGLLRRVYGVSRARFDRNLARTLDALPLEPLLDRQVKRLSLGQRVQADVAATFLHDPSVVFLDEPTIGLDLDVKDLVRTFVKARVAEGTTLILTSHDLNDIENLCERIVMIADGRMVYDGDLTELQRRYARGRTVSLSLPRPVTDQDLDQVRTVVPHGTELAADGQWLHIVADRYEVTQMQVVRAVLPHVPVTDFEIHEESIESVVRKLYRGELGDRADNGAH